MPRRNNLPLHPLMKERGEVAMLSTVLTHHQLTNPIGVRLAHQYKVVCHLIGLAGVEAGHYAELYLLHRCGHCIQLMSLRERRKRVKMKLRSQVNRTCKLCVHTIQYKSSIPYLNLGIEPYEIRFQLYYQ